MTSSSQAWKRPKSPSAGARSLISHLQPGQKIVPALRIERFFETIYACYDERFVFAAPIFATCKVTPRIEWDASSPLFDQGLLAEPGEVPELDYEPRISSRA